MNVPPAILQYWVSTSRFESVCRLCWSESADCSRLDKPLYISTEGFRGTLTIKDILTRLLQLMNYDNEVLPQNICETCLETVLRFFTFWQLCRHTEEQLVTHLTLLSKRVAALYSQVVEEKKKSKYNCQNSAILILKNKKIDYFNCNDTQAKLKETQKFLNRNVPKSVKINSIKNNINNKALMIKSIKDNTTKKSNTFKTSSLKFYCSYCSENFAHNNDLTDHLKVRHHIYDIAECTECGKKFKTIQLLKHHSETHKTAISKCSICKSDFESASAIEAHINETHTEYKYKCPDCPELFQRERDVSIHQWNTHKIGYEYYCKVCGKKFRNYYAVKSHEESHEGFDCDRCGQKFDRRLKLKAHLATCLQDVENSREITPVMSYSCDYCCKNFYRKATLRQHILSLHLYPKRFKCTDCDKRVSTKTQLEAHMVVHTRERSEQCSVCGKYFVTKYALTYHMRLHTGERPYACNICDERFLSASRRMAHVKRKHLGRTETCSVCSKSYYSGYALKRHMQRHFDPNSTLYENFTN